MRTPERTNRRKQRVSLLGVIANGSTGDARRLLKKYNQPDAVNHKDLEMKLSRLYANTDDKIILEKEIAEIHPHKEFILHNLAPKPISSEEPEIMVKDVEEKTKLMASTGCPCGNPNCRNNYFSNACGCSSYSGHSNANGSCSGVDGSDTKTTSAEASNNGLMIVSVLGIITIFALSLRR
jgi:hypothetical protein